MTDYESEFKNQGDKIVVRKTPDITVGDYTVGEDIDYQVPATDSDEMNIDQAKYMAFRCDDIDKVQSDINLVNMYAEDASKQLAIVVDKDMLQVMATGVAASNQGATAGAISDINMGINGTAISITATTAADYIVYLNQILDESNMPSEDRFVVIPAWYASRLKTGDLKRADVTGDSSGVIRSGLIGQVDRTKVYVNNSIYEQTAGEFSVIAGRKNATSFAMQLSKTDTLQIPNSFGEYV